MTTTAEQIIDAIEEVLSGTSVVSAALNSAAAVENYIYTLIATWRANTQASIDELHAAALVAANAEAPQGDAPLV